MENKNLSRRHLVQTLEELLSDEFEPNEIMYQTEQELMSRVIEAAFYYKGESHREQYIKQLEHRLLMVLDDINILKRFIDEQGIKDVFEKKNSATSDSGYCNIYNIEIACDLSNDESLSWGMYK